MTLRGADYQRAVTVLDSALCAQVDTEIFFPKQGGSVTAARSSCALCEVRPDCLELALHLGADGIWGGTTPRERMAMGASVVVSAGPFLRTCGTNAGYSRHVRDGEPPCPECVEAARLYQREYAASKASA